MLSEVIKFVLKKLVLLPNIHVAVTFEEDTLPKVVGAISSGNYRINCEYITHPCKAEVFIQPYSHGNESIF